MSPTSSPQVAAPGDRRARRLRLRLEVRADILHERERVECQVIDISQGGTKIRTNLLLEINDPVRIEIPSLGRVSGVVRWVRDSNFGIAFTMPIPYRQLARWLVEQSGEPAPA